MGYIKKIRIKNFKNLEDVEIDMNQLTFLFGPNGSGKSSFMKAMMFLQKNLFPLNIGKTIYKISDDVDLGSYKDIVTNNDEEKEISFIINLAGEFEFPKIDVLNEDKYDLFDHLDYEQIQSLETLENENFFSVFEKLIQPNRNNRYGNPKLECLFIKHNFDISYIITFSNIEEGYNLKEYLIKDNFQSILYFYTRKNLRNDDTRDSVKRYISKERFFFLEKEISNLNFLLSFHFGYERNIEESEQGAYDFLIIPKFNLSKLHCLAEIKSDNFNSYRYDSDKIKTISEEWNAYSIDEKVKFYYGFLKFCYLSHRFIPELVKSFLNVKHLPITREIPQKIYLLERSNFNPKDYYGILNVLAEDFLPTRKYDGNLIISIDKSENYESLYDKILSTADYFENGKQNIVSNFEINNEFEIEIEKEFEIERKSAIELLKSFINEENENVNDQIDLNKEEPRKIEKKGYSEYKKLKNRHFEKINELENKNDHSMINHFKINNYLRILNFNLMYQIEIEGDIGRIYLIGKNKLKMYMSNASSGFLQVFPVIVCCCLLEKYLKLKNKENNEYIKFLHTEFIDKFMEKDSLTNMDDLYTEDEIFLNFNTLLIEQPELHLHPKLQSQMAKIFSDTVKNSTDSHSIVVETHSEHLIRKIQVLIAKG